MNEELILPITVEALVKIALLIGGAMTAAAYLVLVERWIAAWVQDRRGPNRVGIPLTRIRLFGLGQPLADGAKFILKEEYIPAHVDRKLYVLAPVSILVAALAVFAVIPVGSIIPKVLGAKAPIALTAAMTAAEPGERAGIDVGVIYVFALGSLAVFGVILGGWASNNKYSFLGGLRSSAQLIAYELPLGLGILGVVILAGSLRLDDIILQQARTGQWNILTQPLGFAVFLVAAFAEAARLPFDLPECEQELIGGYHTEYSGIKLLMYLVAEFLHMVVGAFLIVILFLGGWHVWGMPMPADGAVGWPLALARVAVLLVKVFAVILFFMLARWSWPRFRFDQLMGLAWKVMLPLGLVNLVAAAVLAELNHVPGAGVRPLAWWMILASWGVALAAWVIVAVTNPAQTTNQRATRQPGAVA